MSPSFSLSRHGWSVLLPLLPVVVAHAVLLVMLAGRAAPEPPVTGALPVALLVAASAAAPEASPALPPEPAAPGEAGPAPEPEPMPEPLPVAVAPRAPALVPASAGDLPAPSPDALAAAATVPAAASPVDSDPAPVVAAPVLLPPRLAANAARPLYPEAARRQRAEGRVTLRLTVGADGKLATVEVLESSGHPELDRAAREAARRWRLLPALRDGRAVEGVLVKIVEFRLEN